MAVISSQCCTVRLLHLLLHAYDQARLKPARLGVIILCLYLCSITSRNTARSGISCGPAVLCVEGDGLDLLVFWVHIASFTWKLLAQVIYMFFQLPVFLAQVFQILGSFIAEGLVEEINSLLEGESPDPANDCTASK